MRAGNVLADANMAAHTVSGSGAQRAAVAVCKQLSQEGSDSDNNLK